VLQESSLNLVSEGRNSHTSYCGNAIAHSLLSKHLTFNPHAYNCYIHKESFKHNNLKTSYKIWTHFKLNTVESDYVYP
jgi:hypothetical protein